MACRALPSNDKEVPLIYTHQKVFQMQEVHFIDGHYNQYKPDNWG